MGGDPSRNRPRRGPEPRPYAWISGEKGEICHPGAGEPGAGANPPGMGLRRALHDFRELRRSVADLFEVDAAAEEAASFALADAACRFSRQTKDVVDDKLSFSATLMRAGEVQAANRLLAEVEADVRDEEAALLETVNEVKVAESMRRERMTRVRFARMLAVAMVGASLLSFSAAGMALANFLRDRAESGREVVASPASRVATTRDSRDGVLKTERTRMKRLRIGDVKLFLTRSEFERLRAAGGTSIGADGLADLLNALPAPLADKIEEAMTVATAQAEEVTSSIEDLAVEAPKTVDRKKRRAAKAAQAAEEQNDETEPTPEPTESPDDEPTNDQSDEDGDGGEEKKGEDEGGDGGVIPIRP